MLFLWKGFSEGNLRTFLDIVNLSPLSFSVSAMVNAHFNLESLGN